MSQHSPSQKLEITKRFKKCDTKDANFLNCKIKTNAVTILLSWKTKDFLEGVLNDFLVY